MPLFPQYGVGIQHQHHDSTSLRLGRDFEAQSVYQNFIQDGQRIHTPSAAWEGLPNKSVIYMLFGSWYLR